MGEKLPYNIQWDTSEPSILHVNVDAPLNWDAFNQAITEIHDEVAQKSDHVFLVAHIQTPTHPLPMGGWREPFYNAYCTRPANLKKWIVVGTSPVLRVTTHLFMQLHSLLGEPPVIFVPTIHEARQAVHRLHVASR